MNIIFNGEMLNIFYDWTHSRTSTLNNTFNIILEVLFTELRQVKEKAYILESTDKKKSAHACDIVVSLENPKIYQKKNS